MMWKKRLGEADDANDEEIEQMKSDADSSWQTCALGEAFLHKFGFHFTRKIADRRVVMSELTKHGFSQDDSEKLPILGEKFQDAVNDERWEDAEDIRAQIWEIIDGE